MSVTGKDILDRLQQLGLKQGDCVVVHSSLKAFGYVEGAAETVVEALLEMVGSEGLLLMPTYAQTEDANGDLLPLKTHEAQIRTGVIPATFARHPKAHRGHHPMYSLTFAGVGATALARENEKLMFPYGQDHQLRVILREGGYVLLIGVGDRSNSAIHMLEEMNDPEYLQEKKSQSRLTVEQFFAMLPEQRHESLGHHRVGPMRDFTRVTDLLRKHRILRQVRLGNATMTLEPALQVRELLAKVMQKDPYYLVSDARNPSLEY